MSLLPLTSASVSSPLNSPNLIRYQSGGVVDEEVEAEWRKRNFWRRDSSLYWSKTQCVPSSPPRRPAQAGWQLLVKIQCTRSTTLPPEYR